MQQSPNTNFCYFIVDIHFWVEINMTKDLFLNTIIPLRHTIEEALGKENTSFYFDPSTSFVFARVIDRKKKLFTTNDLA